MEQVTLGIVGGKGGMGRLFDAWFVRRGHRVLLADVDTTTTAEELARRCDLIMIATPMDVAPAVAESLGPRMSREQGLFDICSLKEEITGAMLSATSCEVVGTHPMFGPHTDGVVGQNIILTPGRGERWLAFLEREFSAGGAQVSRMAAEDHDRAMALAQGLTHVVTIAMGRTLQKLGVTPDDAQPYATPIFKLKNDLIGRLFAQDPDLYAAMVGDNPYVGEMVETFGGALAETAREMVGAERGGALDYMAEIRSFLGPCCEAGLEESNKILKSMV
ncbi:prephenate dehydrogenase/arogenate dehydrogenase family protein [Desulfoluna butyratoxydans]|uniref:Prephenate dehydrogenase n=1 Tax=Desulfoluna butyratoxydans TaxID=231438 RepID=A0A4U8YNW9_9BACT|nr:prephenate dehydrogenase/arogenate dehydrogenase family protein [Desulfoluna butyratoxydans]VFQ44959.1 prephenate dehydrogenase [Desulfoluna butyratoxydans]